MKAALLQLTSGINPDMNFETVAAIAGKTDAEFILTPERTPFLAKDPDGLRAGVRLEAAVIAPYCALAKDRSIHLLLGSAAILKEDQRDHPPLKPQHRKTQNRSKIEGPISDLTQA